MYNYPSYLELLHNGELVNRAESLYAMMQNCVLCPRLCNKNRVDGSKVICKAGEELTVSSAFAHYGEEPEITGFSGSGTVFLSHCSLRCAFCQNFDISHAGNGETISVERLAEILMELQNLGCHNINFVTPTHFSPHLVDAIHKAALKGLSIPIVWNSSGYESIDVIRLLDGIVDIYMPDLKFLDEISSKRYCKAPDYPEVAKNILIEMNRQVGPLEVDDRGIARRGLLVRHLIMPGHLADTKNILEFISSEISINTYVNIMDQYRSVQNAKRFSEIDRRITREEYIGAIEYASKLGLYRGFGTVP